MTERGASSLSRDQDHLTIGPSGMRWNGKTLTIDVDEVTMPLPSRLRGRITVTPSCLPDTTLDLSQGVHFWRAIAPNANVVVELERPALSWSGRAYMDQNFGSAPLESGFRRWDWSRSALADGSCVVLYDMTTVDGCDTSLSIKFGPDGSVQPIDAPQASSLARTGWRLTRSTRGDTPSTARVLQTLEDTPFYARTLVATQLLGYPVVSMHETLSLDRFRQRWVQGLLPFRMPRTTR